MNVIFSNFNLISMGRFKISRMDLSIKKRKKKRKRKKEDFKNGWTKIKQ